MPDGEYLIPIGKAKISRPGKDVTLIASGVSAHFLREVVLCLVEEGIDVEVIDLRTFNPLDMDSIVASVQKTGRVVVANDGYRTCGFAAEVVTRIVQEAFDYLNAPIKRVTSEDVPVPYAQEIEAEVLISADKILQAIRRIVGTSKPSGREALVLLR